MPTRKALRLPFLDYSTPGMYFITVCAHRRRRILGEISNDQVVLTAAGLIVKRQIEQLPERLAGVGLDLFVVMPNHVHALVQLYERARQASPLRVVVGAFKPGSTREVNLLRGTCGASVWQRGYYDHVIRDGDDLMRAREYIEMNPTRWALDPENV